MKIKENPAIYLFSKMWERSSQNRKKVILFIAMAWIANLLHLCIPLIFALLLNELQLNGVTEKNIFYLLLLCSFFTLRSILGWAFHGPSRMLENDNAFMVRVRYKFAFLSGVLALPMQWHSEHHSGDTNDKLEKGSNGLFMFSENVFRVVMIVNSMVVSFIVLMFFDRAAGFIALSMILITVSIIVKFDRTLAQLYRELNRFENKISEKIFDVISNISTVIILRIEKLLLKSVHAQMLKPRDLFWKINKLNEIKWFLVSFCTNVMLFLVLGNYILQVYWGLPLVLGTFFALYGYANNMADNFFELAGFYGDLLKNKARVLNAEELAKNFRPAHNGTNGNEIRKWNEVCVKSLNFSYLSDEGTDLHLNDVSLVIRHGEKIAFIGTTGSGKTTTLKIIRELYQPQGGHVFLDDIEQPDGFGAISSRITLIPQEPEIFATTIRENITMGVEYDMDTILRFTDMACFTSVVDGLPKKFESAITEKGVNLSGGEKQRLALTRGLLASDDKDIVLLDEPTSSIDVSTESTIYRNIFTAFREKTIISSTHQLHLLRQFDTIYLFDDGKIVAYGTFGELLHNSSLFQSMWSRYEKVPNA